MSPITRHELARRVDGIPGNVAGKYVPHQLYASERAITGADQRDRPRRQNGRHVLPQTRLAIRRCDAHVARWPTRAAIKASAALPTGGGAGVGRPTENRQTRTSSAWTWIARSTWRAKIRQARSVASLISAGRGRPSHSAVDVAQWRPSATRTASDSTSTSTGSPA